MKRAEKKKCLLPTFYSTNDEEMRFERILPEKKEFEAKLHINNKHGLLTKGVANFPATP